MELIGRNVNQVWPEALSELRTRGNVRPSRNGPVTEHPEAVVTRYEKPLERVLFDPARDANPFLHLFDALWILAGRNDVEWLAQFSNQFLSYTDDGKTFHGAYGFRLRSWGDDQFERAVEMLKKDPDSRRVVLTMWNGAIDLNARSKDLPCNTHLYPKIRDGRLLMTVCNRSNDIVWGLYGANVVQWSIVQEYLAARIGVPVGPLTTISDSFHAYDGNKTWDHYRINRRALKLLWLRRFVDDPYAGGTVAPWPLIDVPGKFDDDLKRFMSDPLDELGSMFPERKPYLNSFIWRVAIPMYRAFSAHKKTGNGLDYLKEEDDAQDRQGKKIDWIEAARQWLGRREKPAGGDGNDDRRAAQPANPRARRNPSAVQRRARLRSGAPRADRGGKG